MKVFHRQTDLIRHLQRDHELRPFKCPNCDKTFEAEINMKLHETTHDCGSVPCTVCRKVMKGKKGLNIHMKSHSTTEKAYRCNKCCSQSSQLVFLKNKSVFFVLYFMVVFFFVMEKCFLVLSFPQMCFFFWWKLSFAI